MTKKINVLLYFLIIFCSFSCTKYDNGFTEASIKFTKEFEKEFINYKYTNQKWGFGELTPIFGSTPLTRTVNTNSNEWTNYLEVPNKITEEEREYVTNWFKEHKTPQKFACPTYVNWSDERLDIRKTYPKWQYWINDNSIKFWE